MSRATKVLIDAEEIDRIVSRMAAEINRDYQVVDIVIVEVLRGSTTFRKHLEQKLSMPVRVDSVGIESYLGRESVGKVEIYKGISLNITGCHVLVVEYIIQTACTLTVVKAMLLRHNPRSLKIAVFLDKFSQRKVDVPIDYVGRKIEGNPFVVGYGLDYNDEYRNLPEVRILEDAL